MPPTHEGKGLASLHGLAFGFPTGIRAYQSTSPTPRNCKTSADDSRRVMFMGRMDAATANVH